MTRYFIAFLLCVFFEKNLYAQCEVNLTMPIDTLVCGDCVSLTTFGRGQGPLVFNETFNSGAPTGWAFTQQATFNNPCSPNGVNGTSHIWMGNNSGVPRALETLPFNFTNAIAGATICFDMLFARQGDGAPCEGPDEPDEGVFLQYRIGNGPWITINYFDPNGGNDPLLVNWNNWCFPLPQDAFVPDVQIRWFQDNDSGADFDHWGIDNVEVFFNDPTFTITVNDANGVPFFSFPQGSAGGEVPTPVCPRTTASFSVNMVNTNGDNCQASLTVPVRNPTIILDAGNDTTICEGQCVDLNAEGKVVISPAKTPTYANNQVENITTGLGATTGVNVNVVGLNMETILPGSITSVCISSLSFFGFNFLPPQQVTVSDLNLELVCPDGNRITLVPANTVTASSQALSQFTNTCFVPAGSNIANAAGPFTGNFAPSQPFDNLVGCTADGVWTIEVTMNSPLGFGTGFFVGWSISFDDPEISYDADFVWSPTTNMTNSNTLNPTVCPITDQVYTITAEDSAQCISLSDQVAITVTPTCCVLEFTAAVTEPTCGQSNGSINLNITQGSGNYAFEWADGPVLQNRTGLAAGTYTVTITDNTNPGCFKDTSIILNNPGTLNLSLTNPINPTCGGNDGGITVAVSGGTSPYTITVDNGIAPPQVFNVPVPISQNLNTLPQGNYTVTVEDAAGCLQTQIVNLVASGGPVINSLNAVLETCQGDNLGRITVQASGTPPLTFEWSNLETTPQIDSLSPGNYSVTVTDANGCTVASNTTLIPGPVCCVLNFTAVLQEPNCGQNDGAIDLSVIGGSGNFSFEWSNGVFTEDINSVGAGSFSVTVTDNDLNCDNDTTFVLSSSTGPVIDNVVLQDETCSGAADGSINLSVSGGTGVLNFAWSNGASVSNIANLAPGMYEVTITDDNGCEFIQSFTITAAPPCCTLSATVDVVNTTCNAAVGSITINLDVASGTPPFEFSIDGGQNFSANNIFDNLGANTYDVLVRDINNCEFSTSVDVLEDNNTILLNINTQNVSCFGFADGSIEVLVSGDSPPFSFLWNDNSTNDRLDGIVAGDYSVVVTDATGCQRTADITITEPALFSVDLGNDVSLCSDESIVLDASPGQLFEWSTGGTNASETVSQSGIVGVLVTDDNGCTATDTIEITQIALNLEATADTQIITELDTVQLSSIITGNSGTGIFEWTPSQSLSCSDCPNPLAFPRDTTLYQLVFTDDSGCSASDSVLILVVPAKFNFFMPNAFSPNGDGENEIVFPIMNGVKQFTWRIYDRWGEKVFECLNSTVPCSWDGRFKGKIMDPNVFVWEAVVEFNEPSIGRYKGSLTLLK